MIRIMLFVWRDSNRWLASPGLSLVLARRGAGLARLALRLRLTPKAETFLIHGPPPTEHFLFLPLLSSLILSVLSSPSLSLLLRPFYVTARSCRDSCLSLSRRRHSLCPSFPCRQSGLCPAAERERDGIRSGALPEAGSLHRRPCCDDL